MTSTTLYTNSFEVKLNDDFRLLEYTFSIQPPLAPSNHDLTASVVKEALKALRFKKAVYDGGSRIVTAGHLRTEAGILVGTGGGQGVAFNAPLTTGPGQQQDHAITFKLIRQLRREDVAKFLAGTESVGSAGFVPPLNVILHDKVSKAGKKSGPGLYILPDAALGADVSTIKLTNTLEARTAVFTTVVTAPKRLAVKAKISKRLVYARSIKLSDLMLELIGATPGGLPEWKELIQGLEVIVDFHGLKRSKVVKAVGSGSSQDTTIEWDSKTLTVEEFHSGVRLVHGHDLPVVDVGTLKQALYVPAELCTVEMSKIGQSTLGHLSAGAKKRMSEVSSLAPGNMTQDIRLKVSTALGFANPEASIQAFGITISSSLLDVQAKLLSAPAITYANNAATVQNGFWKAQDFKFFENASSAFEKAAVLGLCEDTGRPGLTSQEINEMSSLIQKSLAARGNPVFEDPFPAVVLNLPKGADDAREDAADIIKREGIDFLSSRGKQNPSILFVVIEGRDDHVYAHVKTICDVELGIPTVVIGAAALRSGISDARSKSIDAHNHPTFLHLAMKANARLGGLNHKVSFESVKLLQDSMVVGISSDLKVGQPKLSTVVASTDSTFSTYPASVRMQDANARSKKIEGLTQMFRARLDAFKSGLPLQIIVFYSGTIDGRLTKERKIVLPGLNSSANINILQGVVAKYGSFEPLVSEGPGNQVQVSFKGQNILGRLLDSGKVVIRIKHRTTFALDLEQMRDAIKSMGKDYKPRLTVISCERDRHTRFFTSESADAKNAEAGTFVTNGNGLGLHFHLQTQSIPEKQKSQTARPTSYTVVYDESKFTAEEVAQGINVLCHSSQTGNRSVSVVPPARWAAKAASHARAYLHDWRFAKEERKAFKRAFLQRSADKGFVHDNLKGTMWYL